jgi:hypothetical protein
MLRRSGQNNYRVNVYDLSLHGCRVEFVERLDLEELLWVKFERLDALEAKFAGRARRLPGFGSPGQFIQACSTCCYAA